MRFLLDRILRIATAPWRWFALRRRRMALLLIPFGLATGRAEASDENVLWTPVMLKQADRTRYDLELTLRARRLLVEDPALARYDIAVRIDDRVAELSGPVPSMEIAQRAEISLRGLLGLASIRNRLTIEDRSKAAKEPGEQARVDWRMPVLGSQTSQPAFLETAFGGSLTEGTANTAFGWRPVQPAGQTVTYPIPFMPEGLSRPTRGREAVRENIAGDREYLRIGKVDLIVIPPETRRDADDFALPAIDLRNVGSKGAQPTPSADSNRLRYFFLGL
jgi:BON domain